MAWYTKLTLFFGLALGAILYSAFGLLFENMGRFRGGVIPLVLYIPVAMAYGTLYICHRVLSKKKKPIPVKATLLFYGLVSLTFGAILANWTWDLAGSWTLKLVWNESKREGYALEAPGAEKMDPSEENAVTWLIRAGRILGSDPKKFPSDRMNDFIREAKKGVLDPQDLGIIRKTVAENKDVLALLERASLCPKVNWEPYGHAPDSPIPHYAWMLNAGRLMACRSILAASQGKYSEAVHWTEIGFWAAKVVSKPKLLIGDMIGLALYQMVLDSTQYRFIRLSEKDLGKIWDGGINPDEPVSNLREDISLDFLLGVKLLAEEGYSMFGADTTFNRFCYFVMGPFFYFDTVSRVRLGKDFLASLRLPYAQMEPAYARAEEKLKRDGWLFTQIALPRFDQMYGRSVVVCAYLRAGRLAWVAREFWKAHGRWPGSLDEMAGSGAHADDFIDPFSGGKMRLRPWEGGLLIYSVGLDLTDDGGLQAYDRTKSEKGDIVFRLAAPLAGGTP